MAAVKAAGTVTDEGAVRAGLPFVMLTTAPPAGAGCESVIVQVLAEFGPRLVGLQSRVETTTEEVSVRVAFAELPLYVAVTVALELPLRVGVLTVKLAVVAAAAIVTLAGTVSRELVLARATTAPPAGAACDRVTVHVADEFDARVVGVQVRVGAETGAVKVTITLAAPSASVAVMVAVEFAVKEAEVTGKDTVVAPAATVADDGAVRTELLLTRVNETPPLGAACEREIVQAPVAFGPRVEGLQASVGFARPTTTAARLTVVFTEKLL